MNNHDCYIYPRYTYMDCTGLEIASLSYEIGYSIQTIQIMTFEIEWKKYFITLLSSYFIVTLSYCHIIGTEN